MIHTACASSMLLDGGSLAVELIVHYPLGQLGGAGAVETAGNCGTNGGGPQRLQSTLGQTGNIALRGHSDKVRGEDWNVSFFPLECDGDGITTEVERSAGNEFQLAVP